MELFPQNLACASIPNTELLISEFDTFVKMAPKVDLLLISFLSLKALYDVDKLLSLLFVWILSIPNELFLNCPNKREPPITFSFNPILLLKKISVCLGFPNVKSFDLVRKNSLFSG